MQTALTMSLMIDLLLALGVVSLAFLSLFSRSLFNGIVLFVCMGMLVALIWIRMNAIDVAIAEAAIGSGLTGALLFAAWSKLKHAPSKQTNKHIENKTQVDEKITKASEKTEQANQINQSEPHV